MPYTILFFLFLIIIVFLYSMIVAPLYSLMDKKGTVCSPASLYYNGRLIIHQVLMCGEPLEYCLWFLIKMFVFIDAIGGQSNRFLCAMYANKIDA